MPQDQYIIRGHLQRPTFNSSELKDLLNKLWNPTKLQIKQTPDWKESSPSEDDNKSLTKKKKVKNFLNLTVQNLTLHRK